MSETIPMADISNVSEEEIFEVAAALSAEERPAYLDAACEGNAPLRARLEHLLVSHESDGFMEEETLTPEIQAEFERLRPEDAGDFIGPYKLLQPIGQGGFGVVWMVEQFQPVRRRAALKVIKLGMDTKEVIARFDQERQALAMMDHPNIARVFDAGMTPSGRPYFVMELVRGTKLTDFCDAHDLSMRDRLELFIRICHAVHHAHQKGVIHRDLKPSNILVGMTDGEAVPKVIDFGVAKATQSRLTEHSLYTQIGQIVGTPAYMSPEQAETTTLDIDTRSDVYSLGVLLYELLTGRTPYSREKIEEVDIEGFRRIIKEQEPLRPSTVLGTLGKDALRTIAHHRHTEPPRLIGALKRDLDWIVMRAIEKDRNRRYDSASALAEDISRHLRAQPVVARPPSLGYRARRLVMRNKAAFLTAGIITVTLIVATIVSVSQAIRANAALRELSATAPAFAAQARELAVRESFPEAVLKLGYAIQLQPASTEFRISRANILQALGRLDEAAKDYRAVLAISPGIERAATNLELCENLLASPRQADGSPSRETLAKLFDSMAAEQRPAAEMMLVAKRIGRENELALEYWRARLQDLPNASDKPIAKRLSARKDGLLELDLRGTGISDLRPLVNMPLGNINLSKCSEIRDIEPLRGMPLRYLNLESTAVSDLSALTGMSTLTSLNVSRTSVSDLSPLADLPLAWLQIAHCDVRDLTPIARHPITFLDLEGSRGIESIAALAAMPLEVLNCSYTNITDFTPLAKCPINKLWLQGCTLGDLSFLEKLPLEVLILTKAKAATNLAVIAEIKTLKELALSDDLEKLPDSELDAVEALRKHPALERLVAYLPEGSVPGEASTVEAFWTKWDRDIGWQRTLRSLEVNAQISRQKDGTWSVKAWAQSAITDLAIFKGANISVLDLSQCRNITDLRPIAGLPLKVLRIAQTKISDLSPLRETRIEELWIADTAVTDLAPLVGLPLRRIYMDKCKAPVDLAPLASITTLESLILPERPASVETLRNLASLRLLSFTYDSKTGRPSRTAAEFWNEWDHHAKLPALRDRDFTLAQLRDAVTILVIRDPAFTDLPGLAAAKLTGLDISRTNITDIAPLATMTTLRHLIIPAAAQNISQLRKLPALERIATAPKPAGNGEPAQTAEEFWKMR